MLNPNSNRNYFSRIIADESELVEEHLSLGETREKHTSLREVSVDLKECFDLYTTAEELRGDNSYHCPHCNRKEEGTLKMIGLWSAPQILVLHLKRFRQGTKGRGSVSKISSLVDFPLESLDLAPHVSKRTRGEPNSAAEQAKTKNNSFGSWRQRASFKKSLPQLPKINGFHDDDNLHYDLFAVCNHHGKDLQGGHYTGKYFSFSNFLALLLPVQVTVKNLNLFRRSQPTAVIRLREPGGISMIRA